MRLLFLLLISFGSDIWAQEYEINDLLNICHTPLGEFKPLKQLICNSTPALIKEMLPNVKLPKCNEKSRAPQVIPEHKPISAVFASCTVYSIPSCFNIAESLIDNKTGATMNLIIKNKFLNNEENIKRLEKLAKKAKKLKVPFNIIPVVDNDYVKYARDQGIFTAQGENSKYNMLPSQGAVYPWRDVLRMCGMPKMDKTYMRDAQFDTTYISLVDLKKDRRPSIDAIEINESIKGSDQGKTEGGNMVALPGGTLIIGTTKNKKPSQYILDRFREKQKVLEIEIPNLDVGHIDEIFRVVPSTNECGFSILRASPLEMKKFIKKLPNDEVVVKAIYKSINEANENRYSELQDREYEISDRIEKLEHKGQKPSSKLIAELETITDKMGEMVNRKNLTASEVLLDNSTMDYWDAQERIIEQATIKIKEEVEKTLGKDCEIAIVNLPVFWNKDGYNKFANPVNGLAINGQYFYSKAKKRLWDMQSHYTKKKGTHWREYYYQPFKKLDDYVHKKLSKVIPSGSSGIHTVDTQEYDSGGGNFHCATVNIHLPCVE